MLDSELADPTVFSTSLGEILWSSSSSRGVFLCEERVSFANGLASTLLLDKDLAPPPDSEKADERPWEDLRYCVEEVLCSGKDSLSLAARDIVLPQTKHSTIPMRERSRSVDGGRAM